MEFNLSDRKLLLLATSRQRHTVGHPRCPALGYPPDSQSEEPRKIPSGSGTGRGK